MPTGHALLSGASGGRRKVALLTQGFRIRRTCRRIRNAFGGTASPPNLPTGGEGGWLRDSERRGAASRVSCAEGRSKRSRRWERDLFPVKALPTSAAVRQHPRASPQPHPNRPGAFRPTPAVRGLEGRRSATSIVAVIAGRAHRSFRLTPPGRFATFGGKCPGCSIIRASLTVALMVSLPSQISAFCALPRTALVFAHACGSLCATRNSPQG